MGINKKILASIFVIGILALAMGYGTYSYFSDTGTSTGNTFTAGTLDLRLSNDGTHWYDGVTNTWVSPSNWAPGEYFEHRLYMQDAGSVAVKYIAVKGENLDNTTFGDHIFLKTIIYTEGGSEYNITDAVIMYYGMDTNDDGKISLTEFVTWCGTYSMWFWTGEWGSANNYLEPNQANYQYLTLGFEFDPEAGNDYQGATAHFDLEIAAQQAWVPTPIWKSSGSYGYQ